MRFKTESVTQFTARLGVLSEIERLPNLSFETPMLLLYTKKGSVPHLTKSVLKMLTTNQEFLSVSLPSTIFMTNVIKNFDSFTEFVGLQEYPFFLSIQDPAQEISHGYQMNETISVWSHNGRFAVTPQKYMEIAEIFKPDMYVTLCDGDTDKNSTQKHIGKTINRSRKLFQKCYEWHNESTILKNKGFLGAIEGGYDLKAREESIKYMGDKGLLGYIIDGLHMNGIHTQNITVDEVEPVIKHSLKLLPQDRLRVLMGCWSPPTVLDLVNLGIDVFDSSYAYLITEQKQALHFLCDGCENNRKIEKNLINLSDQRYKEDFNPICKSCTCLTCKNHTKAYLYHLVQTKELLSQVLLMIHNTHLYMEFFKSIRQHIKNDTFHEFRNKIHAKYSHNIESS